MKVIRFALALIILAAVSACAPKTKLSTASNQSVKWRAVHLIDYNNDSDLDVLGKNIPRLTEMGVNVVILEVDYNFDFKSHPELRRGSSPITKAGARKLVEICRQHRVRLIPEFQSLGHQSWKAETFPLLTVYPKFDLTPGAYPKNEGLYCREWDPLNPQLNPMIFELLDEIVVAFEADALHVGMDEVFLLGSDLSPSTKGQDPARLFAKAVNDLYGHLVKRRRLEMLMWGDRFIDGKKYDYGEWEASINGTAGAVDLVPKDIIICDWHYEKRDAYPSVPMFLEKGFRVLQSGWKNVDATKALIGYSANQTNPKMLGHLFTTWGAKKESLIEYPPIVDGLKLLGEKRTTIAQ